MLSRCSQTCAEAQRSATVPRRGLNSGTLTTFLGSFLLAYSANSTSSQLLVSEPVMK